jgi:hypothetical protein
MLMRLFMPSSKVPHLSKASAREASYKPTRSEMSAIRTGEAEIAQGAHVSLDQLLNDLDRNRRKVRAKGARKNSR